MRLINLSNLKTVLNALDIKYAEVSDQQFLLWLSNEGIVEPTTSNAGELYITNNNEIYIL